MSEAIVKESHFQGLCSNYKSNISRLEKEYEELIYIDRKISERQSELEHKQHRRRSLLNSSFSTGMEIRAIRDYQTQMNERLFGAEFNRVMSGFDEAHVRVDREKQRVRMAISDYESKLQYAEGQAAHWHRIVLLDNG